MRMKAHTKKPTGTEKPSHSLCESLYERQCCWHVFMLNYLFLDWILLQILLHCFQFSTWFLWWGARDEEITWDANQLVIRLQSMAFYISKRSYGCKIISVAGSNSCSCNMIWFIYSNRFFFNWAFFYFPSFPIDFPTTKSF